MMLATGEGGSNLVMGGWGEVRGTSANDFALVSFGFREREKW